MAIPKNKVDRAVREEAAHADIVAIRREIRTRQILVSRRLRTVDNSVAFVYFSCASIEEYGARFGYSGAEARAFALVGAALEVFPLLETEVLDGRLSFDAAAVVAKIIVHPDLGRTAGEWLKVAESSDLAALKRAVRKAIEEANRKDGLTAKTIFLTEKDERNFLDARELACKREGRALTEGEAVGIFSRLYLDEFDRLRAKPAPRRVPDTRTVDSRYVPVEVKREVWKRTHGKCAVWGCRNRRYNQYAHLFPHSAGGHRETSGLVLLCPLHHQEYDSHLLIIEGTAENPVFKDADGNLLPGGPGPPDTG